MKEKNEPCPEDICDGSGVITVEYAPDDLREEKCPHVLAEEKDWKEENDFEDYRQNN